MMQLSPNSQKMVTADFIHHQFADLVKMVNQSTATPQQLIKSIQALEKLMLEQVLPFSPEEKITTPLEQDLLQSLQDIENGDIEIIDETYFANMLKQPVAKDELIESGKDIANQAVTIYE